MGAGLAVSEQDAAAYLTANPFVAANGLKQIAEQFWIQTSISFNFYEAWSNWRRTGFPELTPVNYVNNATNGTIPRRFPYPTAEESTNPDNYREAVSKVPGGDLLTSRVWWDVE